MSNRITIDREIKITLLNWLKQGYIEEEEIKALAVKCGGGAVLSMDEAREFLRLLEEDY